MEKSTNYSKFLQKHITLKIFIPTVSCILILVWLFVYCYYGHLISSKSDQVAAFAYNSKFYKYPLDLRMFTMMLMLRSQQSFFITGFFITRCSLESYARVKKLYSIENIYFVSNDFLKKYFPTVYKLGNFNLHVIQKHIEMKWRP